MKSRLIALVTTLVAMMTLSLVAQETRKPAGTDTRSPTTSGAAPKPIEPASVDPETLKRRYQEARDSVDSSGDRVEELLRKIRALLQEYEVGNDKIVLQTLDDLKEYSRVMQGRGKKLLQAKRELRDQVELFKGALERGLKLLPSKSAQQRQFAKEETEPFFQQQYLRLARSYDDLKERWSGMRQEAASTPRLLEEKLVFVERSVVFFERLDVFIQDYRDPLQTREQLAALRRDLDKYIQDVREGLNLIDQMEKKFGDTSGDGSPEPKSPVRSPEA